MYGLPRKFNIGFDGGGTIAVLEDTNDIGFSAVRVAEGKAVPPGVYFRMALGGITGHKDFARDTGVLLKPEECVPAAAAVVRVFIEHGDRTDRRKARLKYVLDRWGIEKYIEETEKHLPTPFCRLPLDQCEPRPPRSAGPTSASTRNGSRAGSTSASCCRSGGCPATRCGAWRRSPTATAAGRSA